VSVWGLTLTAGGCLLLLLLMLSLLLLLLLLLPLLLCAGCARCLQRLGKHSLVWVVRLCCVRPSAPQSVTV
jgi:hypothetical protein